MVLDEVGVSIELLLLMELSCEIVLLDDTWLEVVLEIKFELEELLLVLTLLPLSPHPVKANKVTKLVK